MGRAATQTVTPATATTCSILLDCRPLAARQHETHCGSTYSNTVRKHTVSIIMNHSLTHSCKHCLVRSAAHPHARLSHSLGHLLARSFAHSLARSVRRSLSNSLIHASKNTHKYMQTHTPHPQYLHRSIDIEKRVAKQKKNTAFVIAHVLQTHTIMQLNIIQACSTR